MTSEAKKVWTIVFYQCVQVKNSKGQKAVIKDELCRINTGRVLYLEAIDLAQKTYVPGSDGYTVS